MKLTDLDIDGFGVWHDLKLANLSPRVTAFYGANEAGKTTVMQFIRTVLYGVTPERRKRYLPPLDGGRPGGTLGVIEGDNRFHANRIADRGDDDVGRVVCTTPDGATSGDRLLRDALGDIDETAYTNIFAVGLDEIQELGTLSGTKAAEWLYRLTSGIDRVSLYDVMLDLRSNRTSLLADRSVTSRIPELEATRDQLVADIDRLRQRNRSWSSLAVRIAELDEQIAAAEREVRKCEHRARTAEIAVGIKDNWRKREQLDLQLAQLAGRVKLPEDAVDRLNELSAKIEKHQRQADILQGQRQQLKEESERLGINELLVNCSCRIDALGEQRDWLQSLERQREDLEREARQFESRVASEQKRLADVLGLAEARHLREITETDLENLQPQIDALRAAQKRLDAAQRNLDSLTENERSLKTQIDTAIIGGEQHGLPMDLQEASDLVAQLRKRMQVEQRLEQARQHELELEQQGHELLDDQVMPLWMFGWLFATFVLGALMLGIWVLVPDAPFGKYGGLIALLGVGAAAFAWIFKYFTEDSAAERLDACQRQMDTLARQIAETEREKEAVDAELPMTDGSVLLRLQAAERHLAELENVLPVEAQRKQAGSAVADAEARVRQAQHDLNQETKQWQAKVAALGMPETLDAHKLASVAERFATLGELEARGKHRREDAAARQREYDTLLRRVHDLAEETGCLCELDGDEAEADALAQLDHLVSERRKQASALQRRDELREKAKELKAEEGKHRESIGGLKRRRTALFTGAGCADEQEFRMLAADQHQARMMANQRDSITREILAAIGKHEPEEVFAELLSPEAIGILETSWESATAQLDGAQERLKEFAQQRGVLKREQQAIEEDRSLAERQLDLGIVEQQLAAARRSWREHAVVSRMLERIRADYEAHRQPETLAEASKYMSDLTGGRYTRVWTPLANDILLVENSEGESLPVDVLSRGTREQLFLSVRLALVATFARRGVNLPMVLDDVLVNCDAGRAKRAADVLTRFAAGGRQVLVFSCHEHIWEMFKALDADCRRLPNRRGGVVIAEPEPVAIVEPEPIIEEIEVVAEEPAPKRKKRRPKQRTAKPVVEEIVEEIVEPAVEEPVDFYEYPFVERLVEERVPVPAEPMEAQTAVFDYTFDSQPVESVAEPIAPGALAYIVAGDEYEDRPVDQAGYLDWDDHDFAHDELAGYEMRSERRA
ncbi:MAG: AAA family ATPase [Planctomycetales bacterium]|nr:AAA family ATPase [Planctomycetales bacterium]